MINAIKNLWQMITGEYKEVLWFTERAETYIALTNKLNKENDELCIRNNRLSLDRDKNITKIIEQGKRLTNCAKAQNADLDELKIRGNTIKDLTIYNHDLAHERDELKLDLEECRNRDSNYSDLKQIHDTLEAKIKRYPVLPKLDSLADEDKFKGVMSIYNWLDDNLIYEIGLSMEINIDDDFIPPFIAEDFS